MLGGEGTNSCPVRRRSNASVPWDGAHLSLRSESAPPRLAWQMAYLTGSTYAHHGNMFTMRVKYDFQ